MNTADTASTEQGLLSVLPPDDPSRKLTASKAASCMARDRSVVTGFILTDPSGAVGIVNKSAVRWLTATEMKDVMNGTAP